MVVYPHSYVPQNLAYFWVYVLSSIQNICVVNIQKISFPIWARTNCNVSYLPESPFPVARARGELGRTECWNPSCRPQGSLLNIYEEPLRLAALNQTGGRATQRARRLPGAAGIMTSFLSACLKHLTCYQNGANHNCYSRFLLDRP